MARSGGATEKIQMCSVLSNLPTEPLRTLSFTTPFSFFIILKVKRHLPCHWREVLGDIVISKLTKESSLPRQIWSPLLPPLRCQFLLWNLSSNSWYSSRASTMLCAQQMEELLTCHQEQRPTLGSVLCTSLQGKGTEETVHAQCMPSAAHLKHGPVRRLQEPALPVETSKRASQGEPAAAASSALRVLPFFKNPGWMGGQEAWGPALHPWGDSFTHSLYNSLLNARWCASLWGDSKAQGTRQVCSLTLARVELTGKQCIRTMQPATGTECNWCYGVGSTG